MQDAHKFDVAYTEAEIMADDSVMVVVSGMDMDKDIYTEVYDTHNAACLDAFEEVKRVEVIRTPLSPNIPQRNVIIYPNMIGWDYMIFTVSAGETHCQNPRSRQTITRDRFRVFRNIIIREQMKIMELSSLTRNRGASIGNGMRLKYKITQSCTASRGIEAGLTIFNVMFVLLNMNLSLAVLVWIYI